jgi:hypothetical protein
MPDPAWKVDGRDTLASWSDPHISLPERTLCWEWRSEGMHQLAAMRGNLKLVITEGGRPELFDVVHDPAERRSLAAELPEVVKSLDKALKDWLATERDDRPKPTR